MLSVSKDLPPRKVSTTLSRRRNDTTSNSTVDIIQTKTKQRKIMYLCWVKRRLTVYSFVINTGLIMSAMVKRVIASVHHFFLVTSPAMKKRVVALFWPVLRGTNITLVMQRRIYVHAKVETARIITIV